MEILLIVMIGAILGGVIYLFTASKRIADVLPIDRLEREALRKAKENLEKGLQEARDKYTIKRQEYEKIRGAFLLKNKSIIEEMNKPKEQTDKDKL